MTDVVVVTLAVVTVNPAAVVPAPTVTLAGTLTTAGLLLDSDTVAPPVGAPADSETNADVFEPPLTLDGLTVTLFSVTPAPAGVTVRFADRTEPLYVAVIVTVVAVVDRGRRHRECPGEAVERNGGRRRHAGDRGVAARQRDHRTIGCRNVGLRRQPQHVCTPKPCGPRNVWAQRDSNPRHLPCKGSALAN